jgi:hypothetical protein
MGAGAIAFIMLVTAAGTGRTPLEPVAWQSRAAWKPVSKQIISDVTSRARQISNDPSRAIVYVYGEPALFFHLYQTGTQAILPAGDTLLTEGSDVQVPTFLVAGPELRDKFPQLESRMEMLGKYEYFPSDLVLLNYHHPRELRTDAAISRQVRLYRISSWRPGL